MRRFVVFLMFLFRMTTNTTRRFPTKPMTIIREKRMGTRKGTIFIRNSKSFFKEHSGCVMSVSLQFTSVMFVMFDILEMSWRHLHDAVSAVH